MWREASISRTVCNASLCLPLSSLKGTGSEIGEPYQMLQNWGLLYWNFLLFTLSLAVSFPVLVSQFHVEDDFVFKLTGSIYEANIWDTVDNMFHVLPLRLR